MIPDDIRRFIVQCIPSVPFLEALLLLREDPDRTWDAAAVAARLYLDPRAADTLLDDLARAHFVTREASDARACRYAPRTAELAALVDALATVYRHHLIEVSTLIHSKGGRKAALFADALVWRKKER